MPAASAPLVRIVDVIPETPNAKTLVLERVDGQPLSYQAGQFITLLFTDNTGAEQRRSYSFSSSPAAGEPPAITIKRVENGIYSRRLLDSVVKGMTLPFTGISGFFLLPDSGTWETFTFFAAGSGITPVFSLIKTALYQTPGVVITLIYSNRNTREAIFLEELKRLRLRFPARFQLILLFSETREIGKARLNNFMITSMLKEMPASRLKRTFFFLCGPVDYMDTVKITLQTEGIDATQIRKETFFSPLPERRAEPPDRATRLVHIRTGSDTHTLAVQYPVSILDAALEAGLSIPFSCRSGQCGSCTLLCTEGKVWMEYNEVLTPKEIEQGFVLTCSGYPVAGDVELRTRFTR